MSFFGIPLDTLFRQADQTKAFQEATANISAEEFEHLIDQVASSFREEGDTVSLQRLHQFISKAGGFKWEDVGTYSSAIHQKGGPEKFFTQEARLKTISALMSLGQEARLHAFCITSPAGKIATIPTTQNHLM